MFVVWKGDHSPRHVHVYRDAELVVKWDLENDRPMKGWRTTPAVILRVIRELADEDAL